ncbi:MAG: flagellar hook-length control protein FliK [Steroidobacterales bacterium]
MATAGQSAPRKAAAPHAQNDATTGASLPPHGNSAPQPPAPLPLPAAPVPAALPFTPGAMALATSPSAGLKADGIPAVIEPGAPPTGLAKAASSAMADRPVLSGATVAREAAAPLSSQDNTGAQTNATAATAPSPDPGAVAAALPDSSAMDAAAAAALAERLATMPGNGVASPGKGAPALTANGSTGPGSTAATPDAPSSAGTAATAPIVPVLAQQNAGAPDKQMHDSASSAPGTSLVSAAASIAAGEAGVRSLGVSQGTAPAPNAAPPAPNVNSPQFPDQIAAHVSYLVDQNLNGATLQVNPQELGPIELRVSVEAGHAQVWLSAHSAATCDALQQSSPKLREMLASQGFGQVSVDVSQRSFQDRSAHARTLVWSGAAEPAVTAVTAAAAVPQPWPARIPTGALDAYA